MPSTSVDHSGAPARTAAPAASPAPGRLRSNPWLTLCAVAFGLFMVPTGPSSPSPTPPSAAT